ncbi:hypothetical protein AgCh_018764 [Apium graveolens]
MEGTCTNLVLYSTIWLLFSISTLPSSAVHVLTINQTIRDGDTLVSANQEFELGFFSPGHSTKRYVGIWFKKISQGTSVWVANRDAPLTNTSGILMIQNKAFSILDNATSTIIWSSNYSRFVENPVAQLLDSGNLVFRDQEEHGGQEDFVWQSFDYPGDTILAGMKLGVDSERGIQLEHSSWKSEDDPSPGSYVHKVDVHGYPQLLLWKKSQLHSRSGPWVGNRFSGDPLVKTRIYKNELVIGQKEIYYISHPLDNSSDTPATRVILTPNGNLQRQVWNDPKQEWTNFVNTVLSDCDQYGYCGPYSTCDISTAPRCACLRGFIPKMQEKWDAGDWTDGGVRVTPLDCGRGEGFTRYAGVKLPDTRRSWYSLSLNLEDCKSICLKNCSCIAYSSSTNVEKDPSGCLLWFEALMDITGFTKYGQDIYVKMPASMSDKSKRSRVNPMPFISIAVVLTVISILVALYLFKKKRLRSKGRLNSDADQDTELPFFEFKRVAKATCNFSRDNKIGEGGFGPVYKGLLEDGQLIAVKRLSENSRQGKDEFKNEVSLIAKLQHRNLVSLLGYCTEEGERILIYEYMPNKSLDSLIFDFGMARSFGGSQTEANTTRVVGTYGYMPPEYVIDGVFSIKSDVYSFGVLVLEIVSGKKNRCFEHPDHNLNLLGHAWRCYNEQKLEELVDGEILESNQHEVFRVIQIGLLSVQEYPGDRPDMSSVVLMLNSKTELPKPKHPGFFTARKRHPNEYSSSEPMLSSSNNYSITKVATR